MKASIHVAVTSFKTSIRVEILFSKGQHWRRKMAIRVLTPSYPMIWNTGHSASMIVIATKITRLRTKKSGSKIDL